MLILHDWTIKRSGAGLRISGVGKSTDGPADERLTVSVKAVAIDDGRIHARGDDDRVVARLMIASAEPRE